MLADVVMNTEECSLINAKYFWHNISDSLLTLAVYIF